MDKKVNSIRKKLFSFNKDQMDTKSISSRQKEAVEKMIFLTNDQFSELLEDVCNEIDMRNKNELCYVKHPDLSDKRNLSRKKLRGLDFSKFSNLVTDVLLVLNHRVPSRNKKQPGMDDMLSDLEDILSGLKRRKSDEEKVANMLNSVTDFQEQNRIFTAYLKNNFQKNRMDTSVIDVMEKRAEDYFREDFSRFIEYLCNAKGFLDYLDKIISGSLAPEYEYYRSSLDFLIKKRPKCYKRLAKVEMVRIFELLLRNRNVIGTADTEVSIYDETVDLIDALGSLVSALKIDMDDDTLSQSKDQLLSASQVFYQKLKSVNVEMDDNLCKTYENQQKTLESVLSEQVAEHGLFNFLIEFTYFLKELIAILKLEI